MAVMAMLTAKDGLAWRLEGDGWLFLGFWSWSGVGDAERARCGGDGGGYCCWSWTGWLRDYQLAGEETGTNVRWWWL